MRLIHRIIAFALSVLLCVNALPTFAIAEDSLQDSSSDHVLLYRTHVSGTEALEAEDGWNSLTVDQLRAATQDAAAAEPMAQEAALAPLDSLEVKLSGEEKGVSYVVRDETGTWSERWDSDGEEAKAAAITGIAVRLDDELQSEHDVWYRVADAQGSWRAWVKGDEKAVCDDEAGTPQAVCRIEVVLADKGVNVGELTATKEDETAGDELAAPETETAEDTAADPATDTVETPEPATNATETQAPAEDKTKEEGAGQTAQEGVAKEESAGNDSQKTTSSEAPALSAAAGSPEVEYRAHVQRIGWQQWVKNGATAGTTGRSLRAEGMIFRLNNASGDILCDAHVQKKGWMPAVHANQVAGTQGQALRMEAIKLRLSGAIAKTYDISYRVHVQSIGWQGWVSNGAVAGTTGRSLRIEAVQVKLVPKKGTNSGTNTGGSTLGIRYQAHVQKIGWQGEVANGAIAGTSGQSLRMEALRIKATGLKGGVTYQAHVQSYGWMNWVSNGAVAGTTGASKRIEALCIKLTDATDASKYDIYYRTHVQSIGWTAWAKNGEKSGSVGLSKRMEAIQIILQPKSKTAPSNSDAATSLKCWNVPGVTYAAQIAGSGWQSKRSNGATAGTTGQSARIRGFKASLDGAGYGGIRYMVRQTSGSWTDWKADNAQLISSANINTIRIQLTGRVSSLANVWYRVHVSGKGWLDWASNAAYAGSDSVLHPIEAIEVRVLAKGATPGLTGVPYEYVNQLHGVDLSSHNWNASSGGITISGLPADFVVVKATQYNSSSNKRYINPYFKNMANQTLNCGKLLGLYHYATGANALAEADFFCDTVKDYKGKAILFLDWEGEQNPTFQSGSDVIWCKTFLDRVKSRMGGTPMIYMSKSTTNYYNWSSVAKSYPLWGAQYATMNAVYGFQSNPWQSSGNWGVWGARPKIFQYSSEGQLSGNNGNSYLPVDLNLFYGSRDNWKAYEK